MKEFKIGQEIVFTEDLMAKKALSEEGTLIKKGTKAYVGADKMLHFLNEDIMPMDTEPKGYDRQSIATQIATRLLYCVPMFEEHLEEVDTTLEELIEEIDYILNERFGMY